MLYRTRAAARLADATVIAVANEPLCPVDLSRKVPTKPVRAGGKLSTRVEVINAGATPLNALNVQVGLPSDCCASNTGKGRQEGTGFACVEASVS